MYRFWAFTHAALGAMNAALFFHTGNPLCLAATGLCGFMVFMNLKRM